MKKSAQTAFVILFLAIISMVPVVQTCIEYRADPGHRIQMLDLVEDIFITPLKKANADAALIDSLAFSIDILGREIASTAAADSPDLQKATGYCDESIIKVKMLKQGGVDYNRHIAGAKNRFAAADTAKPYYRALAAVNRDLDAVLAALQAAEDPSVLDLKIRQCGSDMASVKTLSGGKKGIASYPGLTLGALSRIMVGADYLRPYEKEMEKSSIFARTIRPWLLFGYYRVFNDMGSKGMMGRHNWFFYRSDVDYLVKPYVTDVHSKVVDPSDVPITDSMVKTVVAFKNQLAERGIDLLFVIMPTKPSIYPDMLTSRMKPEVAAGTISHSLRMMDDLRQAGVETVDLFKAFAEERKNDAIAGDSLYMRTDTHFKGRGVLATAKTIANRVKQYGWYSPGMADYGIDSVTVARFGDIGEMTGFPQSIMDLHRPPFQAESIKCCQVAEQTRDEQDAVVDRTLYKDNFRTSTILVLGDSYSRIYQTDQPKSAGWIAHLARELSQPVASIVNDGGASTLVRQTLARKPNVLKGKKLVIWEVVERDIRFGEEGWKDVAINTR